MRGVFVASIGFLADGIIRRDDVSDSEYTIEASTMPYVVMVNPGGSAKSSLKSNSSFNVECAGTLIGAKHVITAAHCFEDGASQKGFNIEINGVKIKAAATHFNPNCEFKLKNDGPNRCDVAIVELESSTDVVPVPVYRWGDEVGKHMDIYGWGVTGDASSIKRKDCDDGAEDSNFRHGENTVDKVSAPSNGGGVIYYTMSANTDSDTLPLEAISASGDSGGPAFIRGPDGKQYIAGTNSGSNDRNGCIYGATDQYCRLSQHYDWIQSIVGKSDEFRLPAVESSDLDAYIEQQMSAGKIGGMSVTVVQNDQVLWNNAYGSTKPGDSKAPKVTNDTAFMFASLSKTNIAIAAMILYEKGLLSPEDDVNKHLNFSVRNPNFKTEVVTIHHLLTHTASISDKEYDNIPIYMSGDPTISLYETVYNYLTIDGVWGKKGKSWSTKKKPGEKFDYSNIGACLMAYVCEVIAVEHGFASDFDDLVRTHIYAPLGMQSGEGGYFARDFETLEPPAYALPSQYKKGWKNCETYSVMDYPTCDWRSSSLTYSKLFGMFINFGSYKGTRILKKETVEYMRQRSGFASNGEEPSNAMWLYEDNLISGYKTVLGHDGSDAGVSTYAYFNPSTGVGYILLTNADLDGKGSVDDTSIAIGGHLMSIFDKGGQKEDRQLRNSARKRRVKSRLQVTGYPGSFSAPGCNDLFTAIV